MKSETKKLTKRSQWSEYALEKYLCEEVKRRGGVALKYSNMASTGYPDRVCLLPDGFTVWVELKSTGRRPTKLQHLRISYLREIGHNVYWADSRKMIDNILAIYDLHHAKDPI